MRSTLFIALQCCQCSTMQVKQQKKSSNKWNCAVCNEKQSVRKVFAQGYKAKELRFFVQAFNMSRRSVGDDHEKVLIGTPEEVGDDGHGGDGDIQALDDLRKKKRRTDWNEYLDTPNEHRQRSIGEGGDGGDFEPKIVTEMPKEVVKIPRLKNYANGGRSAASTAEGDDGNKLNEPLLSKKEVKKSNDIEPRTLESARTKSASKWNAYISPEEEDGLQVGRREDSRDDIEEWSRAIFEISKIDQRVEDAIHPDFM